MSPLLTCSLKDCGLKCFNSVIYEDIKGKLFEALFQEIQKERNGFDIDRTILKEVDLPDTESYLFPYYPHRVPLGQSADALCRTACLPSQVATCSRHLEGKG